MQPQIVLSTLNAKYIHASLGLRCLMANLRRHGGPEVADQTVMREFTIHRSAADVAQALSEAVPGERPLFGLGVYIWNEAQTLALVLALRELRPDACIVLGGPQLSYEWENHPLVHQADYLITGWGDVSFARLCKDWLDGRPPPSPTRAGRCRVIAGIQPPLNELDLPYEHYSDDDLKHRIVYVEASRGCPFKCAFCLSSLDATAWSFPLDPFLEAVGRLWERGARRFKFVDRTFNLKVDTSNRILQFFLDRHAADPHDSFFVHFELVPDHLPDALRERLARFPPNSLQLEIGIQSLNPQVQSLIDRKQNPEKTQSHVRWLLGHSHAHLHLDLIFGLPQEDWTSFGRGFDQVWSWRPQEIQLGLLKRLPGTPLAQQSPAGGSPKWGMVYDTQSPYALIENDSVSALEVQQFKVIARYWDLLANSGRFTRTLPNILGTPAPSSDPSSTPDFERPGAFQALVQLVEFLHRRFDRTHAITPEMLVDGLFDYLCNELGVAPESARHGLRQDYRDSGAKGMPDCLKACLKT